MRAGESVMTHPTSAIKHEVHQLVDLQIQTLRQESALTSSDLVGYHLRSEKITALYQEIGQMSRTCVETQLPRRS
jgi:hypothetical protein